MLPVPSGADSVLTFSMAPLGSGEKRDSGATRVVVFVKEKSQRHLDANTTRDRGTRVAATRARGPVATFATFTTVPLLSAPAR